MLTWEVLNSLARDVSGGCILPLRSTSRALAKLRSKLRRMLKRRCVLSISISTNISQCVRSKRLKVRSSPPSLSEVVDGYPAEGAKLFGRIAHNRKKTGILAENEQDNANIWNKMRHVDEQVADLISVRIVQFAQAYDATVLVFEHLGNLKPTKGKYSKRGNEKKAYWMKGRIFNYAKYKAFNAGILTCRVHPRNTSRECAHCHSLVARYHAN